MEQSLHGDTKCWASAYYNSQGAGIVDGTYKDYTKVAACQLNLNRLSKLTLPPQILPNLLLVSICFLKILYAYE